MKAAAFGSWSIRSTWAAISLSSFCASCSTAAGSGSAPAAPAPCLSRFRKYERGTLTVTLTCLSLCPASIESLSTVTGLSAYSVSVREVLLTLASPAPAPISLSVFARAPARPAGRVSLVSVSSSLCRLSGSGANSRVLTTLRVTESVRTLTATITPGM